MPTSVLYTPATICHLDRNDVLVEVATAAPSKNCFTVDYAVTELRRRRSAIVAQSDMAAVRLRMEGAGVKW